MSKLSYKDAGVDIAGADAFVKNIAALAKATHIPGVVSHGSEYAGLFRPDLKGLQDPMLAATCDGVGTKLMIARACRSYRGLGQDLVGMNVNDLLPSGAQPLFFLDYIATGKLDPDAMQSVVAGIADACRLAGCALLGGETAEMPGVYPTGEFDLAGFAVGLVDGKRVPNPRSVVAGDIVLGLPSSGVHSNGLSLARKALLERGKLQLVAHMPALGAGLGETLLVPTAIYVREVLALHALGTVKASAHITGGGITGRAIRLLQPGQRLHLEVSRIKAPPIFDLIAAAGDVDIDEMRCTFNMGIGFLAVVDEATAARAEAAGHGFVRIGKIIAGAPGIDFV